MPKAKAVKKESPRNPDREKGMKLAVLFVFFMLFVTAIGVISYLKRPAAKPVDYMVPFLEFSGDKQPCGPFKPWGIAVSGEEIALTDQGQKERVLFFDRQGKFLRKIDAKKAGAPAFQEISSLCFDQKGDLFVIDTWNAMVRGFDPKGKPLPILDLNNKGYYGPRGLACDDGGFIIADTGGHRLVRIDAKGAFRAVWGKRGPGKVEFNNPTQVLLDKEGNYYVADVDNHRVQCLDPQGNFLREIPLSAPPASIAIDNNRGLLFVSSLEGGFIHIYSLKGELLGNLVPAGQMGGIGGINAMFAMENGYLLAVQGKSGRVLILNPVSIKKKS